MSKKNKLEQKMDSAKAAEFFKMLASAVGEDNAEGAEEFGISLQNFSRLKIEVEKTNSGRILLEVKVKEGDNKTKNKETEPLETQSDEEKQVAESKDKKPAAHADLEQVESKKDSKAETMKVSIDEEECSGCEDCVDAVPLVFEMTEDGELARAKLKEIPADLVDDVKDAADDCPADAIALE